ncbi:type II toxin-antitoxin system RelE/ParE family toxin [Niabella beijingensis]|uniref:type II toxin-antitoxin system RelE/ParE family toxin n=1 Tax=Niabella beijingensis TaxID=2872700 RepID=UPI001CC0A99F|nr:type II toxin-antitoxin system RelE/ParE family toxin [Niabella beijingensis]MBZ4188647.1 type II toxin-antitoxin system RelE/ParE family toxin [Niabella beijingensis]
MMGYQAEYSNRARREFIEAWAWYEKQQAQLGDRFEKEIFQKVKQLEEAPKRYPKRYRLYRETAIDVFPYLIIYRLDEKSNRLIIVSVFHTSRNPAKKYGKK